MIPMLTTQQRVAPDFVGFGRSGKLTLWISLLERPLTKKLPVEVCMQVLN